MSLRIENLSIEIGASQNRRARVVESVSIHVPAAATTALVGESGSGKSLTALAVMGLLPPQARISGGAIYLDQHELTRLGERDLRAIRGAKIAMIFQEPMTSLHPMLTVGWQIAEALLAHRLATPAQAHRHSIELLAEVGIQDAERRAAAYPHEFSGGMRQRAMIAMALACRPRVLVADEPTTALDVTTQKQILDLIRSLQRAHGLAVLLITHDLGVVKNYADHAAVMYAGRVVETGPAAQVLEQPRHPYTQALLACVPRLHTSNGARPARLQTIAGEPPSLWSLGELPGCAFAPRCPLALAEAGCLTQRPPLEPLDARDQRCACWRSAETVRLNLATSA